MDPSSSSIAKTLLPLGANENQTSPLSQRLRAVAEQLHRSAAYKDLVGKDSSEPVPSSMTFYRTNRDGSVVTLNSAGRAIALENRAGKRLYSYQYNDANDVQPNRIELSDGSVFEKRSDVSVNGASNDVWLMKSSHPEVANMEFFDAVLTIGQDGSFAIKYKCQLASSIKREDVVREICFNARGKKVIELVKSTYSRVGPGNSITVKEILVRQKSTES